MRRRWGGAVLVAEREMRERVRSRSFRVITVVLILASLALVIVPALFDDDGVSTTRIGVVGGSPGLPAALEAAGAAGGLNIEVQGVTAPQARQGVDAGRLKAAVIAADTGARVIVRSELTDELRATIQQGVALARVRAALTAAGVSADRIAALDRAPRVDVVVLAPDTSPPSGDVGVGVLVAVVLYIALLFAGTLLASGVAEEKTSRVSEVLLASLRPIELLVGKVVGIGLISIVQLGIAAAPALIAALAIGAVDLPDATATAIGWGLVWFVVGYLLYAAAYGALGALVGRQQEVGQVTAPLAMLLLAGYLSAAYTASDPGGSLATTLSLIPPLSPLVMPVRIAAGTVGAGEVALALALTLALAAAILVIGARIYRSGITHTGARTSIAQALRGGSRKRVRTT